MWAGAVDGARNSILIGLEMESEQHASGGGRPHQHLQCDGGGRRDSCQHGHRVIVDDDGIGAAGLGHGVSMGLHGYFFRNLVQTFLLRAIPVTR